MSEPRFHEMSEQRRKPSPWWGIHEARYRFALNHVRGDKLLDVACGAGYGLPILLGAVRYAVGIDIDHSALQSAQLETKDVNGAVVLADGCYVPFGNDTFDAITSFETIEHVKNGARLVSEFARVLSPG